VQLSDVLCLRTLSICAVLAALMLSGGSEELLVPNSRNEVWGQAFCVGLLKGLMYQNQSSCPPDGVTVGQIYRFVVQYIDSRPARMHEDFRKLALEAMKAAWPCKR
jgi:hypothetical protein